MKTWTKILIVVAVCCAGAVVVAVKNSQMQRSNTGTTGTTTDQLAEHVKPEASSTTDPSSTNGLAHSAGTIQVKKPRLLSFGAGWCVPCRMMEPVREQLRAEYGEQFELVHYDVDRNKEVAAKYNVKLIPTLIFLDAEGRELGRRQGYTPKDEILAQWKQYGFEFKPGSNDAR